MPRPPAVTIAAISRCPLLRASAGPLPGQAFTMNPLPPLHSFLRVLVADASGMAPQQVGMHDRLVEDLRIDSLEMAGMLVQIENDLGIALDAGTVQSIQTVQQLETAVAKCMAERA